MLAQTLARSFRSAAFRAVSRPAALPVRFYSGAPPLTKELATIRMMDILEGFSKVNQSKISVDASFSQDLGLDSLDVVDVVMEMESEFSIEIPDEHADQLKTVSQAIDYVMAQHDAC